MRATARRLLPSECAAGSSNSELEAYPESGTKRFQSLGIRQPPPRPYPCVGRQGDDRCPNVLSLPRPMARRRAAVLTLGLRNRPALPSQGFTRASAGPEFSDLDLPCGIDRGWRASHHRISDPRRCTLGGDHQCVLFPFPAALRQRTASCRYDRRAIGDRWLRYSLPGAGRDIVRRPLIRATRDHHPRQFYRILRNTGVNWVARSSKDCASSFRTSFWQVTGVESSTVRCPDPKPPKPLKKNRIHLPTRLEYGTSVALMQSHRR